MEVDSVGIIAILSMSYITTHIVKTDKCGKNPQSTRRKPNYHTKCGKNCHKILSVWGRLGLVVTDFVSRLLYFLHSTFRKAVIYQSFE